MIHFKHNETGRVKDCPEGFSWTTLFFLSWVPLFRGMYGYALFCFFIELITSGLSRFVFCFTINKSYVKFLLKKGYIPTNKEGMDKISKMGIVVCSPPLRNNLERQKNDFDLVA